MKLHIYTFKDGIDNLPLLDKIYQIYELGYHPQDNNKKNVKIKNTIVYDIEQFLYKKVPYLRIGICCDTGNNSCVECSKSVIESLIEKNNKQFNWSNIVLKHLSLNHNNKYTNIPSSNVPILNIPISNIPIFNKPILKVDIPQDEDDEEYCNDNEMSKNIIMLSPIENQKLLTTLQNINSTQINNSNNRNNNDNINNKILTHNKIFNNSNNNNNHNNNNSNNNNKSNNHLLKYQVIELQDENTLTKQSSFSFNSIPRSTVLINVQSMSPKSNNRQSNSNQENNGDDSNKQVKSLAYSSPPSCTHKMFISLFCCITPQQHQQ